MFTYDLFYLLKKENFGSKMLKNMRFWVKNDQKSNLFGRKRSKNWHFLLKNDLRPTSNSLSTALRPPPTALRPTCDPPHFSLATHPHFRLRPATEPPQFGGVLGGYCPRVVGIMSTLNHPIQSSSQIIAVNSRNFRLDINMTNFYFLIYQKNLVYFF